MPYDERLAERVRKLLVTEETLEERKMFGGLSFMVRGNFCCGVLHDDLVVRVDRDAWTAALRQPHVRELDFTGRSVRGWLYVGPGGTRTAKSLAAWVERSAAFAESLPPSGGGRRRRRTA